VKRALLVAAAALIVLAAALLGLRVSVLLFGSWWRYEGAPTADEWSAFFGAFVVVGLVFAWYQLRQVDQSNRELADSNEEVRRVNLELVRPRVLAEFDYERALFKSRQAEFTGSILVTISSTGASTAHDVAVSVTPPLQSLPRFFKPEKMEEYLAGVNQKFDGSVLFPQLTPGQRHGYFLGRFPDLTNDESGLPRRYTVTVTYTDAARINNFAESFTLDLDANRSIEVRTDPVVRLGKDVEVVGDQLKLIQKELRSGVGAQRGNAEAIERLAQARRPTIKASSRARGQTRWPRRR
jgi:hypothetical protein